MKPDNRMLITEGKTKKVWARAEDPYIVDIENKDDITAGDGARHDVMVGKAVSATHTTCHCFELLRRMGLNTHYLAPVDERTFRARRMRMIPIELVARRIATGSFLKRRPDVTEGRVFDNLVIEFFAKDDANHDPLMIPDFTGNRILYYDAKQPLAAGFLREESMSGTGRGLYELVPKLVSSTERAFKILERAWAAQNVSLVDLKIECGRDDEHEDIIRISDVIDNDSWRIWPGGEKTNMKDKQVYRNLAETSPETLAAVHDNYAWVAQATRQFLEITT